MNMSNEESFGILKSIKKAYSIDSADVATYSPLTLAYIGDSVHSLVVKSVITLRGNCSANQLNKKTIEHVKAVNQAKVAQYYIDNMILSEEEADIMRRGRNAKSASVAKNASVGEYRTATGLEALIGYLYLTDRTDRMIELVRIGMEYIDTINK